jgi:hypothetical protein
MWVDRWILKEGARVCGGRGQLWQFAAMEFESGFECAERVVEG